MKFKYNGKVYNPTNLEKKLKKLGISMSDIEIIEDAKEIEEKRDITLYHFLDKETGYTIVSIYDNLDHLKDIINISKYERQLT